MRFTEIVRRVNLSLFFSIIFFNRRRAIYDDVWRDAKTISCLKGSASQKMKSDHCSSYLVASGNINSSFNSPLITFSGGRARNLTYIQSLIKNKVISNDVYFNKLVLTSIVVLS